MMPKRTLLVVLVACTWCLATSAYATNTDGQTQGGTHDAQSSQAGASGHLFGDHTGSGPSTGNTLASPHASGSGSGSVSAGSCDPGSNAGMGPHVPSCNGNGSSGSDGSSSSSSPSWQSLLPGSIQ